MKVSCVSAELLAEEIVMVRELDSSNHKNLTAYSTQRVLRWRLLLEEFDVTYRYKTGQTNFIADALSRILTSRMEREEMTVTPLDLALAIVGLTGLHS